MTHPSAPADPAATGAPRHPGLDALRLVAVLAVALFHFGYRGAAEGGYTAVSLPSLAAWLPLGAYGVQLFFVISGFVIASSAQGRDAPGFALARAARIYPAFVACMTITALAAPLIDGAFWAVSPLRWLANLAIVSPALGQRFVDGAYWSLVYEITFYALVTGLLALGLFGRLQAVVLGWLALSLLNELVLIGAVPPLGKALRVLLITNDSGFFAAGMLLRALRAEGATPARLGLLALATLTAAFQATLLLPWMREHYGSAPGVVEAALVGPVAVALTGLACLPRRLPGPAGLWLALGGLTYPFYLLHQHLGYALLNRLSGLAPAPVLIAGVTLALIALSYAAWRRLDLPGQGLARRALAPLAEVARGIARRRRPTLVAGE